MNTRKCSFSECPRDVYAKGLCRGHYTQQYYGKPLTPLRPWLRQADAEKAGGKECRTCHEWKTLDQFYTSSSQPGHRASCKACVIPKHTAINKARREREKA